MGSSGEIGIEWNNNNNKQPKKKRERMHNTQIQTRIAIFYPKVKYVVVVVGFSSSSPKIRLFDMVFVICHLSFSISLRFSRTEFAIQLSHFPFTHIKMVNRSMCFVWCFAFTTLSYTVFAACMSCYICLCENESSNNSHAHAIHATYTYTHTHARIWFVRAV